jgi:hypothetical protein
VLLLLVCASTQLYTQQTAAPLGSHPLLEGLMGQQQSAAALVTALLQLVVLQPQQPAQLQLYTTPAAGSTGVMRLVRTAAGALSRQSIRCQEFVLPCLHNCIHDLTCCPKHQKQRPFLAGYIGMRASSSQ